MYVHTYTVYCENTTNIDQKQVQTLEVWPEKLILGYNKLRDTYKTFAATYVRRHRASQK